MKWRLRRIITCVIVVFTIILVSACNMKNKSFELKQEGVYSNYIRAARDYHEKIYGKNGIFRYGNVLNEHMQTREHMAQSNGNESILTYFVLLVYEENGQQIASNYLCEVKKSEFEKIVKKNIVKETSYVEDAVKASDKVTSNRSKTGSIDFDLKTGEIELTPAIKIGAFGIKTDIGKIYDALGDTVIGSAAGIENIVNKIRNNEIRENEIVEKMTDAQYFYSVAFYSRHIYEDKGIKVSNVKSGDEKQYLDEDEMQMYTDLLKKEGWISNTKNANTQVISNYEKYIRDNNIVKKPKLEYSKITNKKLYLKNYKIEIPDYYRMYKDSNIEKGYYTALFSKDDSILVMHQYETKIGNVESNSVNDIESLINKISSDLGGKEQFVIDNNSTCQIDSEMGVGYLYELMSEKCFSMIYSFNDYDQKLSYYLAMLEFLDADVEYKNDFEEICKGIKRIKDDIKILGKKELLKDNKGDLVDNIKQYFNDNGFTNIVLIPEFDAINEKAAKLGSFITLGQIPAIKDYVYDIKINDRDFDGSQVYRENDCVKIYFHEDKEFENKYQNMESDKNDSKLEIEYVNFYDVTKNENVNNDEEENINEDYFNEFVKDKEKASNKTFVGIEYNYSNEKYTIIDDSLIAKSGINNDDVISYIGATTDGQVYEKFVDNNGDELSTEKLKEFYNTPQKDIKDVKIQYVLEGKDKLYVVIERKNGLKTFKEYKILTLDENYYENISSGMFVTGDGSEDNINWFIFCINKDSIAEKVGLKQNDIIKVIDDENYEGEGINGEVEEIREKTGTKQTIVVKRRIEDSDDYEELTFELQY